MSVLATLLVVGSMDDARSDIIGNGNIHQSFVERLSQVSHCLAHPESISTSVIALAWSSSHIV